MKSPTPLALTIVALVAGMATWSCENEPAPCGELSGTDAEEWNPKLRGDVEAALGPRRQALEAEPDNDEARRAYAEVLFKLGDIWEADEVIAPLGTTATCHAGDLRLTARTAYLLGDYDRAVTLNERLLELAGNGTDVHAQALRGLTLAHYQTNDFASARELPVAETTEGSASLLTFMQAFEGEPYGIEWTGDERIAHLPMTNDITQPGALPLVTLEINGEAVNLILDTGGDRLYLDKGIYERLALPTLANREASYAHTGGETVEEPLGVAATVTMGDVTLSNVPVIGATWKALGQTSDGVLTTQILKQFLATVDYDNRRITFRERSAEALAQVMETFGDTPPVEAPFYMTSTHLMFAKGSLNGHPGMNYFLDSGLAASMPLVIVEETVEFLELEKTEIEGTPYYWSPIESHGLDGLPSGPAQALGNVFVESDFFWSSGFMADVLISHQYLWPKGSWTIDFDEMKCYFPRGPWPQRTVRAPHRPYTSLNMNLAPFVLWAARKADRDPEGCLGLVGGGLFLGLGAVVGMWLLPEQLGDWRVPGGIALTFASVVALAVGIGALKSAPEKLDTTEGDGHQAGPAPPSSGPSGMRASLPASPPNGFKPAKTGNGFTRSLNVDGWWTNCWIGRTRGVLTAKVFAPSRNGVQVQEAPLMERDCESEREAFEWLRAAEASGLIRQEALRAISRFEKFENDDHDIPV